jgi:hypothetical protein
VKLIIEKLNNGFLVNGWAEPGEPFNGQSAFTTFAEVVAFIRSRMEPEVEGEKDERWKSVRIGDWVECQTADQKGPYQGKVLSFHGEPGCLALKVDVPGEGKYYFDAEGAKPIPDPTEPAPEPDTREPRRFMDDKPEAAAEPAWKPAKVGDKVQCTLGHWYFVAKEYPESKLWLCIRDDGASFRLDRERIVSILPPAPNHGDFGSMNQEGGA